MSPAPKRSKRKAAAEAEAAAAEPEVTGKKKKGKKGKKGKAAEAEAATATKGRASKDYGVTGEEIAQMREDGQSWQEIQDEVGAKSAIPLRKLLDAYKAEADEDNALDPDDADAIVSARDEDALGWSAMSARSGLSVAALKKIYTDNDGLQVDGRAYKDKDGNVHFKLGTNGAKADDDESDDADTGEYADMSRKELVAELKERGLDTKGKSPVLISRLMENDEENEPEPEPTPKKKKGKKKGAKAGRA